ncbi:nucleoid-associated protein [Phragmitibacter flavus]|nr:nucleoid-associated protein [Phragmitibacter flavus]
MPAKIRFSSSIATGLVLAKIGNPQRDEPLLTSRDVFKVDEADQATLTTIFVKPFRNLVGHRFSHHSSLEQHEMNTLAKAIFTSEDGLGLLEKGCDIAKRLYSKSNHPNIKAGDLCISLIKDIEFDGKMTKGLCILKSESVTPFLSISTRNGDLQLHTEQGINPEKIDKGCLIIDVHSDQGYYVLTFDRTSGESRFWVRDFLGVKVVTDASYLTKSYADMAVSFLEQETPKEDDNSPPWETCVAAREALEFFEGRESFDLGEFEQQVLKSPEVVAKFTEHRNKIEEESGQPLEKNFEISKKDISKAKKKIGAIMKLDNGVEIHLKSNFLLEPSNPTIERGFDDEKKMKFVKVYYHQETPGS